MKDLQSNTITPDIPTPARLVHDDVIIRKARLWDGIRIGTICAVCASFTLESSTNIRSEHTLTHH